MKRTITTLSLLLAFFYSFASGHVPDNGPGVNKEAGIAALDARPVFQSDQNCTVSQSATVSLYAVKFVITCSSTRPTCGEASAEALRCIRAYVNQLREAVK